MAPCKEYVWSSAPESRRPAVLVVCSSAAQGESIKNTCKASNWNVSIARGWRDAAFALSRCLTDVILCDEVLADGSWKDVLSTIAPMPQSPRLIVLSDGASAAVCAEVINLGGFDVIGKPVGEGEIGRAVDAGCRSIQYEKEARAKKNVKVMSAATGFSAA